ncbi:hypothetical protein WG219_04070 [Ectopseudomonas mendocina]|uniref:Zinc ribbon domain-containing protein n=1 Tax=Ectopseudomonas mendocina TaxID=300 RepID=A0ABZ2RJR5_ECTME
MGEIKRHGFADGPYEHLLQRLTTALDEADELEAVTEQPQMELELRGLTGSEVQLIQAYLDRDVEWLSGWHAAAKEAEAAEVGESAPFRPVTPMLEGAGERGYAPESLKLTLRCAICGEHRDWPKAVGVQICQACGSQLFRAERGY